MTTNQSHEPEEVSARGFDECQYEYSDGVRCCIYRSCHPSEVLNHNFIEEPSAFATLWSTAPRSRTARIEREDAEWWWRQGQRSVTKTVTEDLREIHRLVSGRLEK